MAKSAADRIGILGGSFNPIHNGHLKLAEYAHSELNLDKVYLVPANRNAFKNASPLMSATLRVKLLKRALKGKKTLALSTCDIRRGGNTYTIDTLKDFRRKFGPKTVFYFLAGADNAKSISRWKSADKVLKLCRFTVLSRPGTPRAKVPSGVLWLDFPALDVSSSQIRQKLKQGRPLGSLVPRGTEALLKDSMRKADQRSISKRK